MLKVCLPNIGLWPLVLALSIEPQAACTLKITGYGLSHAEVLCSLLSFLPRVERRQSSRYPGITCWIVVNSRGRRHISPRLEASSSSSSSEELGCVSDFRWFQLVPIWILLHWCNRFVKGLISWRDRLCFASTAALVRPKQGSANFLTLTCKALKHDSAR